VSTSRDLRRRLSSFDARRTELYLWRGVRESRQPLSTRGARLLGGRWNPPGLAALYASFEPVTVRAELARAAERRRQVEAALYPILLVQVAVEAELVDLTTQERLEALGIPSPFSILTPPDLTRRIGAAAAEVGLGALIVPSVVTRGDNVVLFPDNLTEPVGVVSQRRISAPERWPTSG
jgi:RES domain-containing protein